MIYRAFIFAAVVALQAAITFAAPEVQLSKGLIRGREAATYTNKTYYAFEKIPYASPPIGELRFKAPVPPSNWVEPLDTVELDVSCYQVITNLDYESEDCLYLNVFTPELPSENSNPSLPVMVHIHGGGFVRGTAYHTYSDWFVNEDVILITLNYRLGPFGFLSTEDEVIPGNNGLKDQHMAIQWAHDNIQLFGGDSDKIIIFGQSAGSASCGYQLLYQKNRGLFRGAILQSGSPLSPWAFQRKAREIAFNTTAFINETVASSNDSQALLDFLQSIDAKEIDEASDQYYNSATTVANTEIRVGYFWSPVIEVKNPTAILTKKQYLLLQAGNTVGVPVLQGMCSEEGLTQATDEETHKQHMEEYDDNLDWLVPNDMRITDKDNRTEMGRLIREIYTDGEPFADNLGAGVRYFSDQSFTRSVIKHATFYSKHSEIYFYEFSYSGKLGGEHVLYENAEKVGHAEDNRYTFCSGNACNLDDYSESDKLTQQRLVSIWTNFAKYLNPTPEPSDLLQNITWPRLSTDGSDFYYVDIDENLEIKNHPKENTYGKWIELYDSLEYNDFDTF